MVLVDQKIIPFSRYPGPSLLKDTYPESKIYNVYLLVKGFLTTYDGLYNHNVLKIIYISRFRSPERGFGQDGYQSSSSSGGGGRGRGGFQ